MSMSNFSAKENTNLKVKKEIESGLQDESQKYEHFIGSFLNKRKHHSNNIIAAHININSVRNKLHMLTNINT